MCLKIILEFYWDGKENRNKAYRIISKAAAERSGGIILGFKKSIIIWKPDKIQKCSDGPTDYFNYYFSFCRRM